MKSQIKSLGLGISLLLLVPAGLAFAQAIAPKPALIEALTPTTDKFQPSVTILSPQEGQTIASTEVPLRLQFQRFPAGKDPKTGLGLHFKVIVDNEPPIDYYDPSQPLKLTLSPGTHTVRVVAARPWDQNYRNLSAFAHVTFNVLQANNQNAPEFSNSKGLITVTSPSGSYGADPILLDYIVDGVNLGRNRAAVRYTLNGQSTTTTNREPIYLSNLQPGANQLVVELVDGNGNVIPNAGFNRVERTVMYQPNGTDSLSRLVRGELKPKDLAGAVGPDPFIYDEKGRPQVLK